MGVVFVGLVCGFNYDFWVVCNEFRGDVGRLVVRSRRVMKLGVCLC